MWFLGMLVGMLIGGMTRSSEGVLVGGHVVLDGTTVAGWNLVRRQEKS